MSFKDKKHHTFLVNNRFTGKYDSTVGNKQYALKVLKRRIVGLRENPDDAKPDRNYQLPLEYKPIPKDIDCIVWLSHASFFIRIGGKTILIDPIMGGLPMVPRITPFIHTPSDFGEIDYLLISHAHYDHLDKKALTAFAPYIKNALLPSKMGEIVKKWLPNVKIQEAVWFEKYLTEGVEITLLPAKHWSKRTPFDANKHLWGSFMIRISTISIYFAGDSAYDDHFKIIGDMFDRPDYCLLGIGAYKPSYMLKNHMSPSQAVDAFNDLKGKNLIPMHYGTFIISYEPTDEPVKLMKEYNESGNINGNLILPKVGQIITI